MNIQRDPEMLIAAWLDDGPAALPVETRQAIVVGMRSLPRRRAGIRWPFGRATSEQTRELRQAGSSPWRTIPMLRRFATMAAAGAAAVVLAIAGFAFLRGLPTQPGGPGESPSPTFTQEPTARPAAVQEMWPQATLDEAREAQELADAGDPDYTWQVDAELRSGFAQPTDDTEITARFLREVVGWDEFRFAPIPEDGFAAGRSSNNAFIRCAPGERNPLYPDDTCAPTIDDTHYERVVLDIAQPVRRGDTGIWVVTRWAPFAPLEQAPPPSEAETSQLLESFLQARIDGEGAERYVEVDTVANAESGNAGAQTDDVPLLYATTTGAGYERSEFEVVEGPDWPDGSIQVQVRLFADGGATEVEQLFLLGRDSNGRLQLVYEYNPATAPTTENGEVVPAAFSLLDGAVTFAAPYPWDYLGSTDERIGLDTDGVTGESVVVIADPRPVDAGCDDGPAAANAAALAASIQADRDLEASAPVTASVGGVDALVMDVTAAPAGRACEQWGVGVVTETGLSGDEQMRLYLLVLPGESARILAIAIIAPPSTFDGPLSADEIVASFQFHAP